MNEKEQLKREWENFILIPLLIGLILLFVESIIKEGSTINIVILGILVSLLLIYKLKKYRLLILIIVTLISIGGLFIKIKYFPDNSIVRLTIFEEQVSKIEKDILLEGDKCEYLLNAFNKLQDDDNKKASVSQLELINRIKECQEKLVKSNARWEQVRKSYNIFLSSRTRVSADNFLAAMSQLDTFDKSRKIKEKNVYYNKSIEIREDIIMLNSIVNSLKKLDLIIKNESQLLSIRHKIEALLNEFENLLIRYRPGDMESSQQQVIMAAYNIKNYKPNSDISAPKPSPISESKPEENKEVTITRKKLDVQRTEVFIDTSALSDRSLEPLKDLLDQKMKSKGFFLSSVQDVNIIKVKLIPPEDGRAIISLARDSEGRYRYQMSLNVKLLQDAKGLDKNIGNVKKLGLGMNELEALQKAQENVSSDIVEMVTDYVRRYHLN